MVTLTLLLTCISTQWVNYLVLKKTSLNQPNFPTCGCQSGIRGIYDFAPLTNTLENHEILQEEEIYCSQKIYVKNGIIFLFEILFAAGYVPYFIILWKFLSMAKNDSKGRRINKFESDSFRIFLSRAKYHLVEGDLKI